MNGFRCKLSHESILCPFVEFVAEIAGERMGNEWGAFGERKSQVRRSPAFRGQAARQNRPEADPSSRKPSTRRAAQQDLAALIDQTEKCGSFLAPSFLSSDRRRPPPVPGHRPWLEMPSKGPKKAAEAMLASGKLSGPSQRDRAVAASKKL